MAGNAETNYSFSYTIAHQHFSLMMSALSRVMPKTRMSASIRQQAAILHAPH